MSSLPLFDVNDTRTVNAAEQGRRLPAKRPRPKRAQTLQEAAQRRDDAIERGLSHADRVKADWRKWAYDYLAGLVKLQTAPFLAEDLVEKAESEGVWCPPVDRRYYGGIIRKLAIDKVIEQCGAARAKTSNCSLKPLWRRVMSADEAVIQNRPEGA